MRELQVCKEGEVKGKGECVMEKGERRGCVGRRSREMRNKGQEGAHVLI